MGDLYDLLPQLAWFVQEIKNAWKYACELKPGGEPETWVEMIQCDIFFNGQQLHQL